MGADEDPEEALLCSNDERLPLTNNPGKSRSVKVGSDASALHFLRFWGIVHIVFHNLLQDSFSLWGHFWVTFLFLLSGFGPATSKLRRGGAARGEDPQWFPRWQTLLRRWAAIYPLYLVSVLCTVLINPHWCTYCLSHKAECGVELLMLQGFHITWSSASRAINSAGWLCAVSLVYWLLEEPVYAALVAAWRRKHQGRIIAATVMLAWWYLLPTCSWYRKINDLRWIEFLHYYAMGAMLAFCLRDRWTSRFPGLGTFAALTLAAIFVIVHDSVDISWCLYDEPQLVAPLFCLLLLGVESGRDPLGTVLSTWPFTLTREVSYAVYILQAPIVAGLERMPPESRWHVVKGTPTFVLAVLMMALPLAVAAQVLVQRPVNSLVRFLCH